MKIQYATIRRSLTGEEQESLRSTVSKMKSLRVQRQSASPDKAAELDVEIRRLTDECERIIGAL